MDIKRYPIPKTKSPFVNTPLVSAGLDPQTGEERFWISTCNSNVGCVGALISASGKIRTYRFEKGQGQAGCCAYSAVYIGNETMWLLSDTAYIRRLNLTTGEVEEFETGARSGLVFGGAQYDEKTGKILFFAYASNRMQGVSYDICNLKTAALFDDLDGSTSMRGGFPNSDGTYTMCSVCGHPALWRWNPATDELVRICDIPEPEPQSFLGTIPGEYGHYLKELGWCDGYTLRKEPAPESEKFWFGRHGDLAYGTEDGIVWCWDMTTGKVTKFCDCDGSARVTRDGCIVSVNLYGLLRKYAPDGTLRIAKWVEADSYGRIDCLVPTDDGKIIGTPFITQRFWIFDENTGRGYDAGKAAPAAGQITKAINRNGKIYMTSYVSGTLVEFDPAKAPGFPENPRVVADTIVGMRPVALTADDRQLYFACNHHYGHTGCIMAKYDTLTGNAAYLDDPMKDHAIKSLFLWNGALWAGTTWQSDCRSAHEPRRDCFLLRLDPDTLEVLEAYPSHDGLTEVRVLGETDGGLLTGFYGDNYYKLFVFDPNAKAFRELGDIPARTAAFFPTETCGEYILQRDGSIERWMLKPGALACTETLFPSDNAYIIAMSLNRINGKPVICAAAKTEFYVIRDF